MIVWGGSSSSAGGIYDPATDTWTATSTTGAPTGRDRHTAIWTGSKMIVWGGSASSGYSDTGGIYDPATDTWTPTSTTGAPTGRADHTAIWTGSKMIVWGGTQGIRSITDWGALNTGGIYDPVTDTWTPTSTTGAPGARFWHPAVWTGSRMIVWGGFVNMSFFFDDGGIYDPATDTWAPTSTSGTPAARFSHSAVWTGSKMIVWGGDDYLNSAVDTGGIYDSATDTWVPMTTAGAPTPRDSHTAVWTGSKMIIWGGSSTNTGGIYDSATDTWVPTTTAGAPTARDSHTAVWTGSKMVIWGGSSTNTGGVYSNSSVLPPPPPPVSFFTVTPCRLVDTRNAAGPSGGPALVGGAVRSFPATGGVCGIPPTAIAVSVNLTTVGPARQGYLTLYRGDAAGPPLVSNVNFATGQTRANNAIVPLATHGGTINVKNGSSGSVHFVLDVNGYFQ